MSTPSADSKPSEVNTTSQDTKPVENTKTNIMYYSIIFPDQYKNILRIVHQTILQGVDDVTQGLFVKTETSIAGCFNAGNGWNRNP